MVLLIPPYRRGRQRSRRGVGVPADVDPSHGGDVDTADGRQTGAFPIHRWASRLDEGELVEASGA